MNLHPFFFPSLLYASIHTISIATTVKEESTASNRKKLQRNVPPLIIGGYLPDYRFDALDDLRPTTKLMTYIVLFSISPGEDGSISGTCCLTPDHYSRARLAKSGSEDDDDINVTDLKVLVSVGGGGRSEYFAGIVFDPIKRARIIKELFELCLREGLDGIDFDWEVPQSRADVTAYTDLLVDASKTFHQSGLNVTVAIHAGQTLPPTAYQSVDRVHLMAYDMPPPEGEGGSRNQYASINAALSVVKHLVRSGCPASKIVLGIPAYGRQLQNPSSVRTISELIDHAISTKGEDGQWTWQDVGGRKGNNHKRGDEEYAYDDTSDVIDKVKAASRLGLAGVFLWEVGQDFRGIGGDPGGVLLRSMRDTVFAVASGGSNEEL